MNILTTLTPTVLFYINELVSPGGAASRTGGCRVVFSFASLEWMAAAAQRKSWVHRCLGDHFGQGNHQFCRCFMVLPIQEPGARVYEIHKTTFGEKEWIMSVIIYMWSSVLLHISTNWSDTNLTFHPKDVFALRCYSSKRKTGKVTTTKESYWSTRPCTTKDALHSYAFILHLCVYTNRKG